MPKSTTMPKSQVSGRDTEQIVAETRKLKASTAVESGDDHSHEVPGPTLAVNSDSCEFGPLRARSGPFARWEGFEPPAA